MTSAYRQQQNRRGSGASYYDWPLQHADDVIKVDNDERRFEVDFDMAQFHPEDIDVKVLNGELIIHCEHDQRPAEHEIRRQISRAYRLPEDVDVSTLKTRMKPNGILEVSANKKYLHRY